MSSVDVNTPVVPRGVLALYAYHAPDGSVISSPGGPCGATGIEVSKLSVSDGPHGVGLPVGVPVAVPVGVAVAVPVAVGVGVAVGVPVGPPPHGMPVIVSTLTPTPATLLSVAILHFSLMLWPLAAAGRFTVVVM